MNPVAATKCSSVDEVLSQEKPGVFFIQEGKVRRILFECPCGCGQHMNLPIYAEGEEKIGTVWKWDGNGDTPTLYPSIRDLMGCRFHGHLTNGVWTFEADSGVKQ
jgi:hypothetical protein